MSVNKSRITQVYSINQVHHKYSDHPEASLEYWVWCLDLIKPS